MLSPSLDAVPKCRFDDRLDPVNILSFFPLHERSEVLLSAYGDLFLSSEDAESNQIFAPEFFPLDEINHLIEPCDLIRRELSFIVEVEIEHWFFLPLAFDLGGLVQLFDPFLLLFQ